MAHSILLRIPSEHSDPEQLKEQAESVRREEAIRDFTERKKRVQEVMGYLLFEFGPWHHFMLSEARHK